MTSYKELQAADLALSEYGQNGGILVTDKTAHAGAWRKIIILSDTEFTTLTSNYTKNDATTATVGSDWGTLTAGTVIVGKYTSVKLASGSVLLIA